MGLCSENAFQPRSGHELDSSRGSVPRGDSGEEGFHGIRVLFSVLENPHGGVVKCTEKHMGWPAIVFRPTLLGKISRPNLLIPVFVHLPSAFKLVYLYCSIERASVCTTISSCITGRERRPAHVYDKIRRQIATKAKLRFHKTYKGANRTVNNSLVRDWTGVG